MSSCVTPSILPSIIYPSTLAHYNADLLANATGTDASVRACTSLDATTKASWALFFAALSSFAKEDPGYFGLGSAMDRAECYGAELKNWQEDKLTKAGCVLSVPSFNPGGSSSDLSKLVQYVAWGAGVVAVAYAVGKVADVAGVLLPARRRAA